MADHQIKECSNLNDYTEPSPKNASGDRRSHLDLRSGAIEESRVSEGDPRISIDPVSEVSGLLFSQ